MKAQIVSFHCVLRNKIGNVISSTFNQDVITQADKPGRLLKGLAEGLHGLRKGDKKSVYLSAEEAYGFYDPELVVEVSRKSIGQGDAIQIGQHVAVYSDEGEVKLYRVIESTSKTITLDANHPLAGQDLIFEIETVETREATSEEIERSDQEDLTLQFQ